MLRNARKDFERVAAGPLLVENIAKRSELAREIEFLLEQEEIKWVHDVYA